MNAPLAPSVSSLPRVSDRMTFMFIEHATVGRDDGALVLADETASTTIPAAMLAVLILGPGTRITHAAVALCGESGCSIIWTGSDLSPMYAYGRPLSGNTSLLLKQAEIVSNERRRLDAARRMYSLRFPGEDLSGLTTRQLLGREGVRMQRRYGAEAKRVGLEWKGRQYRDDTAVNKALDTANHILYGVCHTAIAALGCAPGLGVIHSGDPLSFVFDVADIRKPEITLPVSFDVAKENPPDLRAAVRARMRERMRSTRYLERCISDIRHVLDADGGDDRQVDMKLWSGGGGYIDSGRDLRAQGILP